MMNLGVLKQNKQEFDVENPTEQAKDYVKPCKTPPLGAQDAFSPRRRF